MNAIAELELTNVSRRAFLRGLAAGTFVLAVRISPPAFAQERKYGGEAMSGGLRDDLRIFLSIADDGTVSLLCNRAEMGQGVRTSWAMVVADELEADLARFKVLQAPGDEARYGNQNTDGSRSMRHHFEPLRRIGAAARRMLEEEAAARWGVPVAEVKAENHEVVHGRSGRRFGFGALARGAAQRSVPTREALVVTSDHGHVDEGGHGGTEREVVRIPIVVWGAGVTRGTRAGRGRDVGPTIARLLGIGPLSHATGRPLVHANVVTVRQRAVARAAVRAASSLHVDHVPLTIPVTVVVLLMLSTASSRLVRPLIVSPIYAVVFFGLLLATHTLSFSVSNDPGSFTARVIALSGFAALAQLRVGGRSSLAPASLVTSLVVLGTTVAASQQPLAPTGGMLLFLPIPALAGLAFVCLVTAAIGRFNRAPVEARRQARDAGRRLERVRGGIQAFPDPGTSGWLACAAPVEGAPCRENRAQSSAPRSKRWR